MEDKMLKKRTKMRKNKKKYESGGQNIEKTG